MKTKPTIMLIGPGGLGSVVVAARPSDEAARRALADVER
jgi:hypothetical protein